MVMPGCRCAGELSPGAYETSTAVTDQSFRSRSGTSCRNTTLLPLGVGAEESTACATRAPAPLSKILRLIIGQVNTEERSKSRVPSLGGGIIKLCLGAESLLAGNDTQNACCSHRAEVRSSWLAILPIKGFRMNELTVVDKATEWRRMKSLVLDSVSSPIKKRVYNMALDEFFAWSAQEPRPGFPKATVSAWRVTLEERGLGSSSIIVRMSAIRKLAVEAMDNCLLAPELGAGIQRVKSAKSIGVRMGNWLSQKQAQALLNTPDITTLKGLRDRAIIAVLLGCGLRRSEVAALTMGLV